MLSAAPAPHLLFSCYTVFKFRFQEPTIEYACRVSEDGNELEEMGGSVFFRQKHASDPSAEFLRNQIERN